VRAREAAMLLLSTLDREEMVQRFLDMYAAENRRPGRADRPMLYREQLETIRREAILAMVLRVEKAIPARLKVRVTVRTVSRRKNSSRKNKKSAARWRCVNKPAVELAIPFLDLFREEFFVALGQALRWSDEDGQEFWRDLEVYEKLSGLEPQQASGRSARGIVSGPFVDRTALLLDPSLMEQARRAAGKFQLELNSAADRVLRKIFSRRAGG
jgi:hypothetical protein